MKCHWSAAAALASLTLLASVEANACATFVPIRLEDVRSADAVVIGRISNYHIVLDQIVRQNRRKMLASSPEMPAGQIEILAKQNEFLSDYARFDVTVDAVLVGKPQKTFSVNWDNSTFAEPKTMPAGPFLIALHGTGSPTLLQAPCSSPFLLEAGSPQALEVRKILGRSLTRRP